MTPARPTSAVSRIFRRNCRLSAGSRLPWKALARNQGVRAEPYEQLEGAGRCFGGRFRMRGNGGGAGTVLWEMNDRSMVPGHNVEEGALTAYPPFSRGGALSFRSGGRRV